MYESEKHIYGYHVRNTRLPRPPPDNYYRHD